jgi:DNA-binding NarL/FixJ family response regulator
LSDGPALTIVLADDHEVVRKGLRALLEAQPGFSVVGETADGLQVVSLVERLRPRILVADLMMPGLGGLEVTRRVAKHCPQTRVVVLSMHANESYVLEALRNGALGYVLKNAGAEELVRAIHEAAAGRRYLSPPLSDRAVESYARRAAEGGQDPYGALTAREREVFHLAAAGQGNKEIAKQLGISPRTAETHRANLLRKLGLKGQTELVRFAIERGSTENP